MTWRALTEPEFAPEAGLGSSLDWALGHAGRAPSELNSQPWRHTVHLHDDGTAIVELGLDRSRRLPRVDPDDREAVLACGAWLLNLRLALVAVGLVAQVEVVSDAEQPDLLARVAVAPGRGREVDRDLRLAIYRRATHRAAFEPGTVTAPPLDHLCAEAAREGALVCVLNSREQQELSLLSLRAVQQVRSDNGVQREVAAWTRPRTGPRDGVPGQAHDLGTLQSWLEPTLLRHGRSRTVTDEDARYAAEQPATVVVLGSPKDDRPSLLRVGAGMQRLLLRATALGLAASYRNATLHVPELRRALGRVVQLDHPQVVLRLGLGTGAPTTGRLDGTR